MLELENIRTRNVTLTVSQQMQYRVSYFIMKKLHTKPACTNCLPDDEPREVRNM